MAALAEFRLDIDGLGHRASQDDTMRSLSTPGLPNAAIAVT
jgi:hypothetical protein